VRTQRPTLTAHCRADSRCACQDAHGRAAKLAGSRELTHGRRTFTIAGATGSFGAIAITNRGCEPDRRHSPALDLRCRAGGRAAIRCTGVRRHLGDTRGA
jgi:hypothetical protein